MTKYSRKYSTAAILAALALALATGCGSDNSTVGVSSDRVVDPLPLTLGNSWEYSLQQDAYIDVKIDDTTFIPIHVSSTGTQTVNVTRTESITGDESYGLRYFHVMNYIFTTGADTTVEVHYLAPRGDMVLLKAIESGYNTGGFIPLGLNDKPQPQRLYARVNLGGGTHYIPLERLGHILLDPEPAEGVSSSGSTSALASDGVQNRDNVYFYNYDYVMLYDELFKGRHWIASAAQGVGGLEISRKVTNILPELGGYEGPIAEVEETNSLIESISTLTYKLRFYYKGGVGVVQAEIYDSDFDFYTYDEQGSTYKIGTGTWQVVKKLTGHTVK